MSSAETKIYGQTGEVGKDGLLNQEQQHLLDNIQERASCNAFAYVENMGPDNPFPMIAMATGIGKGKIIHKVIERQIRKKPESKVLVVAGTKLVLVKQTRQALTGYIESEDNDTVTNVTVFIEDNPLEDQRSFLYRTGKLRQKDANVHVATIQTIQSEQSRGRLNPKDYNLLIVDEVHNIGTTKRKATIDQFEKVVGFTATPYRNSGMLKSPEQYGFTVIENLPLLEAQRLRLLPPLVGIQIDTKGLVDEVPTTKTGAIDFARLEKILKESPDLRPYIADRIAKIISDEDRRYKTVVTVNFVWEAQELAELLHEKGIRVGIAVNQQASKEIHTEEIPAINTIERYKLPEDDPNSIQVLISPYVVSEGFDAPATEVLVWASPTDSHLRYTQYTGRLARRAEGKLFGVVVDCLYQTSQYGWSYNMGMWMKGDVKQLENGMLWLGPETDIETLKKLPQVEAVRRQADVKPLESLQKETLLKVQEDDFIISNKTMRNMFIGGYEKLKPIIQIVLSKLKNENAEFIKQRINRATVTTVVTNRERFIELMIESGANLKIAKVTESDFILSQPSLMAVFTGSYYDTIKPILQRVLQKIEEEKQNILDKKSNKGRIVTVITKRNKFIQMMVEEGANLRSSEVKAQDNDFVLSQPSIISTFVGSYAETLAPLIQAVIEQLETENSQFIAKRKRGSNIVIVVTDRNRFIQEMVRRGARLREK